MKTLRRHRTTHRVLICGIASILAAQPDAQAVVLLSTGSGTYTETFDSLALSGTTNVWTDDSTLPGWYAAKSLPAGSPNVTTYRAEAGTTNTGALYSFGSAGSSDRALGSLGSGTPGNFAFGVLFQNTSGSDLSLNAFSFFGEQWRNGANVTAQTMSFSYRISSSPITAFDASSVAPVDWTALSAFNFTSPVATATVAALDGNLPANREQKTGTLGITLPSAQYIAFRWFDANDSGNDHGLSVDDLQLVYAAAGNPTGRNLIWSPITGVWDLTVQNWTEVGIPGTPVAFQTDDRITFDDIGLTQSTVTIQAAGVTIGNTKVTNTTGTYTFIGGAISGSGSVTKTGAGKLILASANTFTGGTGVSEGTLAISADAQLGAATSPLTLAVAGTLETTGSLTLNSTRPVSGTGTISVAPSTTLDIAGPANTGALTLSNTGSLRFSGAASAQVGGFNVQRAIDITSIQPLLLTGPFTTTNADGTVTLSGPLSLGNASRTFSIGDGLSNVDALISGAVSSASGTRKLVKMGLGTLDLTGDNSGLLGGVQIGTAGSAPVNGGRLIVHDSTSLGLGGTGSSGQFFFNPGTLYAAQPIQFPATLSMTIGNGAPLASTFSGADVEFLGPAWFFRTTTAPQLPVGHIIVAESNVRFAAPFANPAGANQTSDLIIRGAGSVTLAAGGTWTGDVFIDGGKLFINGNVLGSINPPDARPAISAGPGGLLGGNVSGSDSLGSISANGSPGSPGVISPGTPADPTGVLTTTALTIFADGLLAMELGGVADGEFDQIALNGSAYIRGQLSLSLVGGFIPALGQTFTVILNDGADQLQPDDLFIGKAEGSEFTANGYSFRINYNAGDGNDVVLTTTVPEPGSAALLFGGLGFLGLSGRRRSQVKPE